MSDVPASAPGAAPGSVPPLVLASASPRRHDLLSMLGLRFEVLPAEIDESLRPGEAPAEAARRLAGEKALAVAGKRPDAIVIGSDTLVALDREILGKPADPAEAVRMVLRLAGREHIVATGIAVLEPGGRSVSGTELVRVRFRELDRATAESYVATGEPLDKAGAYGIQGYGATLVEWIQGDFFAVMGLPIPRLIRALRALGWEYDFRGLRPCRS